MKSLSLTARVLVAIAALGVITVLRFKPWQAGTIAVGGNRDSLTVGFLPVT